MSANDKQVAGTHYRTAIQHWDYVIANNLDYFQAQITKYVTRWKKKGGPKDLEKAEHFLQKYLEAIRAGEPFTPETYFSLTEVPVEVSAPKGVPHYEVQNHFETEGFVLEGDWWRCRQCRERFLAAIGENPSLVHRCVPEEPTGGGYVAQGED